MRMETNDLRTCFKLTAYLVAFSAKDSKITTTDTRHLPHSDRRDDVFCLLSGCVNPTTLRYRGVDELGKAVYERVAFAWTYEITDGGLVHSGDLTWQHLSLVSSDWAESTCTFRR